MNHDRLVSMLQAADASSNGPPQLPEDLADRVRRRRQFVQSRNARVRLVSALAGCYIAGLLSTWGVVPSFPSARNGAADVGAVRNTSYPERSAEPVTGESPVESLTLSDRPDGFHVPSPYEVLRRLGDLRQGKCDVQAAIDYYGHALDRATDEELRVSYERDNWLLISLKKDRILSSNRPAKGA